MNQKCVFGVILIRLCDFFEEIGIEAYSKL